MSREKLSSLCKISNGYAFKSDDYVNEGHRVMRITNVQKGVIVDDDPKFVPNEIAAKANNFKLKTGDILVSLTGNVGRVGRVLQQHLPAVLNQRVGLIRPTSSEIDEGYLFQILNSEKFEREAIQNSNGVAQLNLSSKWIESYEIPLPPLNDQIRIAHLLGKVEGLIAQRKQHLQQLDDLLKSVFLEMFGNPVSNEKGWETKKISDISDSRLGKMRDKKFITGAHLRKYLGNSNVQWFRFILDDLLEMDFDDREREIFKLENGDLLVCEGGDIGRCAIWKNQLEDCYFQKALHRVRLNKRQALPEYIQFVFLFYSLFNGFKITSKATIAHLTGEKLKVTLIPLPPINIQNKFATIVEKVETLKSRYQKSLNDLESLYGALSQQAFKGLLDLSRVTLPDVQPDAQAPEATEPMTAPVVDELTINLPDVDYLLEALTDLSQRERLLSDWLESYRLQIGNTAFSTDTFLAAAQTRVAELHPEPEFELGAGDYEIVKGWVFDALNNGLLQQTQNVTGQDEKGNPILGNLIELRAGVQP